MGNEPDANLTELARTIRVGILERSMEAGVGHIGSGLCIADIIAALFGASLNLDAGPNRDRFVLSKGHAALALYCGLNAVGRLDDDDLASFCVDGSPLGAHPEHSAPGIDFSTGSLGHGLSIGVGAALGARMKGSSSRAFVLLSDAEMNEGSTWEAAMFAVHHGLAGLVAIVDDNGQQAIAKTSEVLDLGPLEERFANWGWEANRIDGHDPDGIRDAIEDAGTAGRPTALIAETVFGKGASFMEGQIAWHYLPMNDQQFAQAMDEVSASR